VNTSTFYILKYCFFKKKDSCEHEKLQKRFEQKSEAFNQAILFRKNPYVRNISVDRVIEIREILHCD
jgi:hypothetical protein